MVVIIRMVWLILLSDFFGSQIKEISENIVTSEKRSEKSGGEGGLDIKKKISRLNVSQLFAELFILWIRTQYYWNKNAGKTEIDTLMDCPDLNLTDFIYKNN